MRLSIEEIIRNGKTQYWIDGHPDGMMGPYAKRAEAMEDLRGIREFERYKDEPDYITTEPPEKNEL